MNLELGSRVQYVKGVGPRKGEILAAAGIRTVADLLSYLPFRYEDRSRIAKIGELRPGEESTVSGEVIGGRLRRTRRPGFKLFEVEVADETGRLQALWFNQEFLKDTFRPGRRVLLFGKLEPRPGGPGFQMKNPQYEVVEPGSEAIHTGRVVPVYERIGPLSPRVIRRIQSSLVEHLPQNLPEFLPEPVRERHGLPARRAALVEAHFPGEGASLERCNAFRSPAQVRLIFEEFFLFYLGLGLRRRQYGSDRKPRPFPVTESIRGIARKVLPFRLTGAQRRVVKTIADELAAPHPMHRLVQGDVGSGKTIVAVLASIIVIENGAQVAFMVPTELLAEQHYQNVRRVLEPAGYRIALLSSGLRRSEREELVAAIARGEVDLAVGTHSLIQGEVRFRELGLAIIDEQHRFGVLQRAELRRKGLRTDLLVMTATPIPRSLTMALYGDLDLSVLDELPPGRKPVRTIVADAAESAGVYGLMEREIAAGHQVYFVCPLIEDSETMDLRAAVATHRMLESGAFAHRRVALVHGRMSGAEREAVMSAFAAGRIDVLVATTVIEVGVDVPNATLIVVDHAERFGLAQLHQLRGRVGRGRAPSTAVLLSHSPLTPEAERRLAAMVETSDGFAIAERDLEIRGPGDYFGTRQSGEPFFRVAHVVRDRDIQERAREEAERFLSSPEASRPEASALMRHVVAIWGERFGLTSGG